MAIKISRTIIQQKRETLLTIDFVKMYLHEIQSQYNDKSILLFYTKSLINHNIPEFQFSIRFKDPDKIKRLFDDREFTQLAEAIEANM